MNGDADDEGDSHSAPEHVNGNAGYPSDRHSEAEHNGQANGHDNHGYGPNAQLSSDEEHSNGQHVGLNVNYHGGDFESLSEDTDSQANQGPAPSSSDEDGEVYEHTNGQANQGPDADSDYDADGEANGHENDDDPILGSDEEPNGLDVSDNLTWISDHHVAGLSDDSQGDISMIDGAADNAAPIANGVLPHTNGVNGLTNGNGAHHNAQPGPDITGPLNNPPLIPSGQHANYMPIPFFPQIAGGPSNAHVTPYAPGGQGMAMTNGNSSVHGHALANGNSSGHGHTQTNGAGSTNAAENMNVGHTPANATGSANGAGNTNGAGNANGGQTMAFPQYPWYPDAGPGAMSGQAIEFWNGLNRSPIANGSNPWPLILEQPWFDHCDDCRDGRQQIRLISSDEQVYNTSKQSAAQCFDLQRMMLQYPSCTYLYKANIPFAQLQGIFLYTNYHQFVPMLYLLAPGEAMRNYYPMRPATSAYDCGYFLKHESEGDNLNWVEENLKYANELDIPIIAAGALYCIEIYQDKEALGNHLRAQLLDRLTDTTIHGMTPAVQTARKNRRERTNGFVPHTQIIDALTDRAEFLPVPNFIWTPAQ